MDRRQRGTFSAPPAARRSSAPARSSSAQRGLSLSESLSIILPVHNSQDSLARQVADILDILPDLTPNFDLLIVDDGSTDGTEEVARELAREYPQVNTVRHATQSGTAVAVQTGMKQTRGDVVFVQDQQAPLSQDDLRQLWQLRYDESLVMARAQENTAKPPAGFVERLFSRLSDLSATCSSRRAPGAIHMIRREAVDLLQSQQRPDSRLMPAEVARSGPGYDGIMKDRKTNFLTWLRQFTFSE